MISALSVIRMLGSLTLITVGFDLASEPITRRLMPRFRRLVAGDPQNVAADLAAGLVAAAPVGSSAPGVVSLVSVADTSAIQASRVFTLLLGMSVGATALTWPLAAVVTAHSLLVAALALLAVGLALRLNAKLAERHYHNAFIGIGIALIGLELVSGKAIGLGAADAAVDRLGTDGATTVIVGFLAGVLLATATRSWPAVTVLAMTLGHSGSIGAAAAVSVALGGGLGASTVVPVASRALGTDARRVASLPVIVAGASSALGLALYLALAHVAADSLSVPLTVAFALTAANALTACLLLPFRRVAGEVMRRRQPDGVADGETAHDLLPGLLPSNLPESLDSNLTLLQSGLARMAEIDSQMVMLVMNASQDGGAIEESRDRMSSLRDSVVALGIRVTAALTRSVQEPTTREQAEQIRHQQRVADELTRISEACVKVLRILRRVHRKEYRIHDEGADELFGFIAQVLDFLRYNNDYLDGRIDSASLELAEQMENTIDKMRDKLKKRARKALEKDQEASIRGELSFIEIVGHLEHIGDSCLAIAETVPMLDRQRYRRRHR